MINEKDIVVIESITDFKMINQGNTAEVYNYGENKILKLFRSNMPRDAVISEYKKASIIQSVLQNVLKIYEFVVYENRCGIVYEKITGIDMIKIMLTKPYKMNSFARELAHFHADFLNNIIDIELTVKQK